MALRYTSGHDTGDCRCRFESKFKTLRYLPSGDGIELGFFSRLQNYRPHPREPKLEKWAPSDFSKKSLIIVHKVAFVLVKSCNSVEDIWVHLCSEMIWVRQEWHIGS